MAVTATSSLAEAVAASAAESVSLLLARVSLIGLPEDASRALVFGCGSGHTTAALADRFGSAVGIDPSSDLVSCAELVHGSHGNCAFAVGGASELAALAGRFDLVYADLSHRQVVEPADVPSTVSALVSALAPGGIAAVGIPARASLRRRASTRWPAVVGGVAVAGGKVTWVSGPEDGTVWIFVRARPSHLHLLPAEQQPDISSGRG
ncbi:MAG: class I SAM-dependent methyltransferase [Gaiellaceae bacterium]